MGIELFERAVEASGRILRAERLLAAGSGDPMRGPGYLLTFDIGRILVAADPKGERLLVREVPAGDDLAVRLASLDEEEPWWRVVGNVLTRVTRVWPAPSGAGALGVSGEVRGFRIQFREDDDNPRVVSFCYEAGGVRVGEEKKEATNGR